MPLYEIAILLHPTKKDAEETGALERLVYGPEHLVAKSEQAAGYTAIRNVTVDPGDMDRLEVLIRPFG